MAKKIKTYEVTTDDSLVFAISLVDEPAIEVNYVALKKDKPQQICLEKEEKHLCVGPVLIPDLPIYRNQEGEEFYIQFSSETIERLSQDYMKNGLQYNLTEQHNGEGNVDGLCVVETWLKTTENDKSNDLGFDLPIGTWMASVKVENDDIWQKVKNGEMNGFSVEAFVNLDEIKLNKVDKMKENEKIELSENFWAKLKEVVLDAINPKEEVKEEAPVEEVKDVEPSKEEAPVEEAKEAKEDEVKEEVKVEAEAETPKDEEKKEVVVEQSIEAEWAAEDVKWQVENSNSEVVVDKEKSIEDLEQVIKSLKEEIEKLKGEIKDKDGKIEEMSKQPSAKPIKAEMKKSENPRDIIQKLHDGTYFK